MALKELKIVTLFKETFLFEIFVRCNETKEINMICNKPEREREREKKKFQGNNYCNDKFKNKS